MRLSLVYAVRDPDYGDGLLHRMRASIETLASLAKVYKLDFELIVVEWNPPPGKLTVRESAVWPASIKSRLRFIEVPREIHEQFESPDLPFLEYIAKNVGIRRSHGDWILACSPDVIFNPPLVHFLAQADLDRHAFYRINRYDIDGDIPLDGTWQDRLGLCGRSVIMVNKSDGSFPPEPEDLQDEPAGRIPSPWLLDWLRTGEPWEGTNSVSPPENDPHTNASGDFLMMARESWFQLRAYTELTTHAHIDSIMCWTAKSAGMHEIVLNGNMRLYHQEHDRSLHDTFPLTDWVVWKEAYVEALESGGVLKANLGDWGLRGVELPEYTGKAIQPAVSKR